MWMDEASSSQKSALEKTNVNIERSFPPPPSGMKRKVDQVEATPLEDTAAVAQEAVFLSDSAKRCAGIDDCIYHMLSHETSEVVGVGQRDESRRKNKQRTQPSRLIQHKHRTPGYPASPIPTPQRPAAYER